MKQQPPPRRSVGAWIKQFFLSPSKVTFASGLSLAGYSSLRLTFPALAGTPWSEFATTAFAIGLFALGILSVATNWSLRSRRYLAGAIPMVALGATSVFAITAAFNSPRDESTIDAKDVIALAVAGTALIFASAYLRGSVEAALAKKPFKPARKSMLSQYLLGGAGTMTGMALATVATNFYVTRSEDLETAASIGVLAAVILLASIALIVGRLSTFRITMIALAIMLVSVGLAAAANQDVIIALGDLASALGVYTLAVVRTHSHKHVEWVVAWTLGTFFLAAWATANEGLKVIGVTLVGIACIGAWYAAMRPSKRPRDRELLTPWRPSSVAPVTAALTSAVITLVVLAMYECTVGRLGAAVAFAGYALAAVAALAMMVFEMTKVDRSAPRGPRPPADPPKTLTRG